jgi:DNA primase large subunit
MAGSDLAKYPFLNEAGEYLRESSFGWEELDRPDMKYIIDRAAERIEMEVDGKIYDNLERYEIEIVTFLISLVIVKSIGIDQVLRKFALA